jgi:DNA primase
MFSAGASLPASVGGERERTSSRAASRPEAIDDSGLGLVPARDRLEQALAGAGYSATEIGASGILADSRWPGRLVGAWRDERGKVKTFWARTLADNAAADARYLYLRGASRTGLPPYGFSDLLAQGPALRRELILVEGVFDVHQLRSHGVENVVALGGTGIQADAVERLYRLGVEKLTLCLDNDEPGRAAVTRIVEQAVRARQCPALVVIDPERLGSAKDPDAYVLARGVAAWRALLEERKCAIGWRVSEFLVGLNDFSPRKRGEQRSHGQALGLGRFRLGWRWSRKTPLGRSRRDAATAQTRLSAPSAPATGLNTAALNPLPRGREAVSISPGL